MMQIVMAITLDNLEELLRKYPENWCVRFGFTSISKKYLYGTHCLVCHYTEDTIVFDMLSAISNFRLDPDICDADTERDLYFADDNQFQPFTHWVWQNIINSHYTGYHQPCECCGNYDFLVECECGKYCCPNCSQQQGWGSHLVTCCECLHIPNCANCQQPAHYSDKFCERSKHRICNVCYRNMNFDWSCRGCELKYRSTVVLSIRDWLARGIGEDRLITSADIENVIHDRVWVEIQDGAIDYAEIEI